MAMRRELSIPILAALLFGAFTALAVGTLFTVLMRFGAESGVGEWVFIAAPSLLAMLAALIVYRRAAERVRNISQSLSRGVLVAFITWISFAAAATWVWCIPSLYGECLRHALFITAALGGGQLLLGSLAAAAITGYAIRNRAGGGKPKG